MIKPVMSPAAAGVLRALMVRSVIDRNRILLTDVTSTDWQSLTFSGERHCLGLRIGAPNSAEVADRLCEGLEDEEFSLAGAIVVDVAVEERVHNADGTTELTIGALTVADD